jgi:hypothetical protein
MIESSGCYLGATSWTVDMCNHRDLFFF